MKYITLVIVIVSYWLLLGFGLNLLVRDEFITSQSMTGNQSYVYLDTSQINLSSEELSEDTSLSAFPSSLKIMFGFRTPIPQGLPTALVVVISTINWFLFILAGISLYMIIFRGAGS